MKYKQIILEIYYSFYKNKHFNKNLNEQETISQKCLGSCQIIYNSILEKCYKKESKSPFFYIKVVENSHEYTGLLIKLLERTFKNK